MTSIDNRDAYVTDSPYRIADGRSDRLIAYDRADDVPGGYGIRVSLKRILMDLRAPEPRLCRWWRFDHSPQLPNVPSGELLSFAEEPSPIGSYVFRITGIPHRSFLHLGNVWIRLGRDATGVTAQYSIAEHWIRVFCEGSMPEGWALDEQQPPAVAAGRADEGGSAA